MRKGHLAMFLLLLLWGAATAKSLATVEDRDLLLSIDERLASLDAVRLTRLDYSVDQLIRRLANVELKLGRFEAKFDLRMEGGGKEERRMEELGDKAARLDARLERIAGKLELLERDLHSSVGDILERLAKGEERCAALEGETAQRRRRVDDMQKRVALSVSREELVRHVGDHFERLSAKVEGVRSTLHRHGNRSEQSATDLQEMLSSAHEHLLAVVRDNKDRIANLSAASFGGPRARTGGGATHEQRLDNVTSLLDRALVMHEARFRELDADVEMYTRKVINGIQQLWKSSDELRSELSDALRQGNRTREVVRQEFRRLYEQIEPLPRLTDLGEDLNGRLTSLSATVDSSLAALLVAQDALLESCRREEAHVYDILQRVVYEMRNRSVGDIHRIVGELHAQSAEIHRSLSEVLGAVLLSGNVTADAVRENRRCSVLFRMDDVDWNSMDAICRHLNLDERPKFSSANNATELESDDEMLYDNELEVVERSGDSLLNDYETEY